MGYIIADKKVLSTHKVKFYANLRNKGKSKRLRKKAETKLEKHLIRLWEYFEGKRKIHVCKEYKKEQRKNQIKFLLKKVNSNEAEKIITTREPKGLFWTKEDELYIAIDNQTGNAWTENFKTREECFEYLKGEKIK